ncbi:hypothetical protein [Acrocarpospora sp. B8E8]|uniref:hypothetical protein n=1 Tax=Acrocarpospora sp. B8E8 TaxID=3153572 RepID=UPI00325E152A
MAGSPARKEVGRVGVRVVPDTSDFGKELKAELARWSKESIEIEVTADLAAFEAELEKELTDRSVSVKVELDTAQAEAQLTAFLKSRNLSVQLDLDTGKAASQLAALRRPATKKLTVNLDAAAALVKIKELTRTESKKIDVDVDSKSLSGAVNQVNQVGSKASGIFSGLGRSVAQVVSGVAGLATNTVSALGGMVSGSEDASKAVAGIGTSIVSVASGLLSLGASTVVLAGIAALLGSVIVAAGAAVLALGAVVIGAGALLALPVIFAGIAMSFMQSSKDLKDEWAELTSVFKEAFKTSLEPMLVAIGDLATKAGEALKEGHPAWDAWNRAVAAASQAIGPLASGFSAFVTNTLSGMATAMENLNANGFWEQIKIGLGTLGQAIGEFFVELSVAGPQIAAGFQGLGESMLLFLPALARLIGAFSSIAPSVIEGVGEAFTILFDAFSANKDVYGAAAQAFADALVNMAPALEQVFRAFALMAPSVLATIAVAVQHFADAISNPETIKGLTVLAETLVNVGAAALTAATNVAANVGQILDTVATKWDILSGTIKETSTVTKQDLQALVDQADSSAESASNLAKQLSTSLAMAESDAVGSIFRLNQEWADKIGQMVKIGQDGAADINQGFVDKFADLRLKLLENGGQITTEWKAQLDKLIADTQASTDPTVQAMGATMQGMLDQATTKGGQISEQFRTFLLQMEDRTKALQIAQLMGIELEDMTAKVKDGVTQAQQNFLKLPEVMQEIISSSKTPEELGAKLDAMNAVISQKAGEGAEAFAKLPEGMADAVATDTISTQVSTIMGKIYTTVTAGVTDAKQSFSELPKALSGVVIGDGTIVSAVQVQMTKVKGTVVTGVNDTSTAFKVLFTNMRSAAAADQTPATIETNMKKVVSTVKTNVDLSVTEFKRLADQAASHGRLTGFTSAISTAMNTAKTTVANAVSQIVSDLSSLNRTFQGPTITAPTVQESGGEANRSSSFAPEPPPMLMAFAAPEPLALTVADNDALSTVTSQVATIASYAGALNSASKQKQDGQPGVTKIYNIDIYAAPDVPTEETLRKQLSYADALYE